LSSAAYFQSCFASPAYNAPLETTEALISKDISYVTEEYVPQRLEEGEFLA
jgi:hypothetical protein